MRLHRVRAGGCRCSVLVHHAKKDSADSNSKPQEERVYDRIHHANRASDDVARLEFKAGREYSKSGENERDARLCHGTKTEKLFSIVFDRPKSSGDKGSDDCGADFKNVRQQFVLWGYN